MDFISLLSLFAGTTVILGYFLFQTKIEAARIKVKAKVRTKGM